MPPLRSLVLLLALAPLAGCDLYSFSSGDLAPGTFEFEAEGRVHTGTARYYPRAELPSSAAVFFAPCTADRFALVTDQFLSAAAGSAFAPSSVTFTPGARRYQYQSGTVEIDAVEPDGIRGTFSVRLRDFAVGPGSGGSTTARGAFYALTSEVGEC